jgi:hypothetical protein
MVHIRVLPSLADCYDMIGEAQGGLSLLDQGRAVRDIRDELGFLDSYYHRLRGKLFLQSGADYEAEKTFRKAIDAAVVRNAKFEVLRSVPNLAQVLIKGGASRGSARNAPGDPRLVHRRIRHRRSEGRQGAARRASVISGLSVRAGR